MGRWVCRSVVGGSVVGGFNKTQSDDASNKSNCNEEGKLLEETWERKNLKSKHCGTSFIKKPSRMISFNKNMSKAQIESKDTSEKLGAEGNVSFTSFRKNIIKNHFFNIGDPLEML